MTKLSKRRKAWVPTLDTNKTYTPEEALQLLQSLKNSKFNETIDASIRLGVDPKKSDQMVRGSCTLPHGTGKVARVLVLATGEKEKEAKAAGADYAGGVEWIEKIKSGWLECDTIVATPDIMAEVGKIGRLLGPKGMMPNPKLGTVTFDVAYAVEEIKKGKVQFRTDKGSNIHTGIGKINFTPQQLVENLQTLIDTLLRLKPATAKGVYIRNVALSSTMGPGVKVEAPLTST